MLLAVAPACGPHDSPASQNRNAPEYKVDPKYKGYVVSVNPAWGGAKTNMDIAYNELKK